MRAEFSKAVKSAAAHRANGRCEQCGTWYKTPQYDHIIPNEFSHDNSLSNVQVLCTGCHTEKTGKHDIPAIAKSNRIRARVAGIRKARTIPGRRFDGTPVYVVRKGGKVNG